MSLTLVLGPMFSGKTSELMRLVRRHQISKRSVIVIKYRGDTRYSGEATLSSHDLYQMPAISASELLPLLDSEAVAKAEVCAIDEGQFFNDVPEFVEGLLSSGKIVLISALDGDYLRRPFGRVLECIPMAEEVVKLTAVCVGCASPAAFTRRIINNTEIKCVGGAESYVPNCRKCYEEGVRAASGATPRKLPASLPASATGSTSPTEPSPGSPVAPCEEVEGEPLGVVQA
jgi:thymidine kinase